MLVISEQKKHKSFISQHIKKNDSFVMKKKLIEAMSLEKMSDLKYFVHLNNTFN